jgi:hypothetical protein
MRLPSFPLLALVNATAEWHAGVPAVCSASVRLLDRVHFMVHSGECVVVHHDDPASARVLLAALGGHQALTSPRRLQGHRHCAPGVRIRRCSISLEAVSALQDGWSAASRGGLSPARGRPAPDAVVHLMRASRQSTISAHEQRQWRSWAQREEATGGALVLVVPPDPHRVAAVLTKPQDGSDGDVPWRQAETIREGAAPDYAGTAPSRDSHDSPGARELWLRHGRLFDLRRWG